MIEALIKIAILIGGLMTAAAYLVLLERKVAAWVQDRKGPNRVGIPLTKIKLGGLGQPMADGLKFIFKEEYTPAHVDRFLFLLAPITIMASALAIFAVIPFGSVIPPAEGTWLDRGLNAVGLDGWDENINLVVAPGFDVGMVYVFALSSIAVYGVILGGWASNNKYSFLGGLRSSAQLIAYEIPLGLGLLGVVLFSGSLRLDKIMEDQATTGFWNAMVQPLGFLVFVVAAFAEAARLPFDLPEAEQELIGGYHTEYSGMKLLLFLIAEFLHMVTASFLIVILFLGGWHLWGMPTGNEISWPIAIARVLILSLKVLAVVFFFMMVRWSWPRFRFDQLMALAWKVMLPLGLINFVAVAVLMEFRGDINQLFGAPADSFWPIVVLSWLVMLVAWILAGVISPFTTDNRPRMPELEVPRVQELRP